MENLKFELTPINGAAGKSRREPCGVQLVNPVNTKRRPAIAVYPM